MLPISWSFKPILYLADSKAYKNSSQNRKEKASRNTLLSRPQESNC
jgi:hypothetical protein